MGVARSQEPSRWLHVSTACIQNFERTSRRLVHRSRARIRHRFRPLQRHVRQVLSAGNHGTRRRALRLRQRRRSRRLSGAGPNARNRHAADSAAARPARRPPVSQRSRNQTRRHAHAPLHRRHRGRAGFTRAATGWASRLATSTTTGSRICISPGLAAIRCSTTTATEHSRIFRRRAEPTIQIRGACPPRSLISIATV